MLKILAGFGLGVAVSVLVFIYLVPTPEPKGSTFGQFIGVVTATFDDNGRLMHLEKDFGYQDPEQKIWHAPAGSTIDGASIPQTFWSVIGGPFEGQYRNASVVHDVACREKHESSDDVHRMFYFACRLGGVGESKAKALYYAVLHFGPQWKVAREVASGLAPDAPGRIVARTMSRPVDIVEARPPTPDEVQAVLKYFESHNPSLDEIPELKVHEAPQ